MDPRGHQPERKEKGWTPTSDANEKQNSALRGWRGAEHTTCLCSLVSHQPNLTGRKTTAQRGLPNAHPARPATRLKFKALCPGQCSHTSVGQQVWKPHEAGLRVLFVAFTSFKFRTVSALRGNGQLPFSHQDVCSRKKGHLGVISRALQLLSSLSVGTRMPTWRCSQEAQARGQVGRCSVNSSLLWVSLVTVTAALTCPLLVAKTDRVFQ